MRITVVTVCLNCEKVIENTIDSVLSQNYSNYEYLIIDGKSSDNTLKIVKNKTSKYDNVRVYSEKDSGIYDAMNKAARLADGEYIYYLNAGDTFADKAVLKKVEKYLKNNNDVYYGNVNRGGIIEKYPSKLKYSYLVLREKMICHQAIFAKKSILIQYPFNLSYRICADRDWLIHIKKENKTSIYMPDIVISNYDCNGISSNYKKFEKESIKIAKNYGGFLAVCFVKFKRILGSIIKKYKLVCIKR